jgi:hypothetical protein
MKILVTGFGTRHVNSGRVHLPVACGHQALVAILKELGHDVDWRSVVPGEDLSAYDKAFVFIIPTNALTARYCYGGLWTIGELNTRCELVVDDWQTRQIITGGRSQVRDTTRFWKDILPRDSREEAMKVRNYLEHTLRELVSDLCPWRIWAPMFRYGNPYTLGLTSKRYVTFDPSSWWMKEKDHLTTEMAEFMHQTGLRKEKRWISASLLDKSVWLARNKFTWPLIQLGNKKTGQERMAEDDVIKLYCKSWGVVSAPHDHPGSGWWRARYPFAAMSSAIIYGSHKDTSPMGRGYKIFAPLEVEEMTDGQLEELSHRQHGTFVNDLMMSPGELRERINHALLDEGYCYVQA